MRPLIAMLIDVTKIALILVWILVLAKFIGWIWKQLRFNKDE